MGIQDANLIVMLVGTIWYAGLKGCAAPGLRLLPWFSHRLSASD